MFQSAHGTWRRLTLAPLLVLAALVPHAVAQGEADQMAGMIFRCAKWVDWPAKKMRPGAPFVIGVMGSESFTEVVREIAGSKKLKDREVVVKHFAAIQEIAGCHVLFVGRSEMQRQKRILAEARGEDVLTFGENESFEKDGGMIVLFLSGGSVRYDVNHRNINRTDLRASSGLFEAASQVKDR
jgi:hypothetical protein